MPVGDHQVLDVLLLVGNVAPIAVYFLTLGLVNSHSRPYPITRRADFAALTAVLLPVLLWPVPRLAHTGSWWMLATGVCLLGGVFYWMLPKQGDGYVIYHISEARCLRVLEIALAALGLEGNWEGKTWRSECGALTIHVRGFALLRNVTLHLEAADHRAASWGQAIGEELQDRLAGIAQLPSPMGAGLVLVGLILMILPMWTVGRHIDDLVDAMLHLFG